MSLKVTLKLPSRIEEKLRSEGGDLQADVTEAYALELFRRGKLTHHELSETLGLDRFETDTYLKRRHVLEGSLSATDLESDRRTLDRLMGEAR